jgi:hypothetical protein
VTDHQPHPDPEWLIDAAIWHGHPVTEEEIARGEQMWANAFADWLEWEWDKT